MRICRGVISVIALFYSVAIAGELKTTLEQQDTGKSKWTAVTVSADCKKVFATLSEGGIRFGTDMGFSTQKMSGYDWYESNAWYRDWQAIAMSDKRELICAVMNGGGIHTSTNGFTSWNVSMVPVASWSATALSETGKHIFATQNQADGTVYVSHNYGAKWAPSRISVVDPWCAVACSSSGMHVAVASCYGGIHISTNYGDDFRVAFAGSASFSAITMDGSGTELVATVNGGRIHVSHDFGATWSTTKSNAAYWKAVTSSKSGQYVYAVVYEGGMFFSENYGEDWSMSKSPIGKWTSIVTSSDGSCIVATDYEGYVYANHTDFFSSIPDWLIVVLSILIGLIVGCGLVWLAVKIYYSAYCRRISNPYKNKSEVILPTRG